MVFYVLLDICGAVLNTHIDSFGDSVDVVIHFVRLANIRIKVIGRVSATLELFSLANDQSTRADWRIII